MNSGRHNPRNGRLSSLPGPEREAASAFPGESYEFAGRPSRSPVGPVPAVRSAVGRVCRTAHARSHGSPRTGATSRPVGAHKHTQSLGPEVASPVGPATGAVRQVACALGAGVLPAWEEVDDRTYPAGLAGAAGRGCPVGIRTPSGTGGHRYGLGVTAATLPTCWLRSSFSVRRESAPESAPPLPCGGPDLSPVIGRAEAWWRHGRWRGR